MATPAKIADELMTSAVPAALLPYQQQGVAILDDPTTDVLAVEKSRRIGFTWGVLAPYAVLRSSRPKSERGSDFMYIGYNQEMTREFIDAAADWAKAFAKGAYETAQEFLFDDTDPAHPDDTRQIKAFRIRFTSGFEIMALSSAPRNLRGKQGVIAIDEAAFVEGLKELLKAALAFLMWGGQVIVVSTHNGVSNPFNVLIQDILAGRLPYKHMHIDFDEALRDGLYKRICLVSGKTWSQEAEDAWRAKIIAFYGDGADEELFCIPNASSGAWLPSTLIEARMQPGIEVLSFELPSNYLQLSPMEQLRLMTPVKWAIKDQLRKLDPERRHCLGGDFARHIDLSVFPVFELEQSTRRRVAFALELRNFPFKEQEELVIMILQGLPRLIGAAFDATGPGMGFAENVQRGMMMADNIIGIMLTQGWYRENMPPVKRAFEDDMIVVPKRDDWLDDLRLVVVVNGVPCVPPLRTGAQGVKRHGDAAIGLVMAWFASNISIGGLFDHLREQYQKQQAALAAEESADE